MGQITFREDQHNESWIDYWTERARYPRFGQEPAQWKTSGREVAKDLFRLQRMRCQMGFVPSPQKAKEFHKLIAHELQWDRRTRHGW